MRTAAGRRASVAQLSVSLSAAGRRRRCSRCAACMPRQSLTVIRWRRAPPGPRQVWTAGRQIRCIPVRRLAAHSAAHCVPLLRCRVCGCCEQLAACQRTGAAALQPHGLSTEPNPSCECVCNTLQCLQQAEQDRARLAELQESMLAVTKQVEQLQPLQPRCSTLELERDTLQHQLSLLQVRGCRCAAVHACALGRLLQAFPFAAAAEHRSSTTSSSTSWQRLQHARLSWMPAWAHTRQSTASCSAPMHSCWGSARPSPSACRCDAS